MELTNEFNLKEIEQSAKDYLSKLDLQKMIDDSSDKRDKIMFIEGPPTLNGEPHAGHLRGRVFKDLWYRFNTLNLKNVIFNAGWDTQGLPVELQAEKELGIKKGREYSLPFFYSLNMVELISAVLTSESGLHLQLPF